MWTIRLTMTSIRAFTPADYAAILRLNEESVHFLSPLSGQRLAHLHAQSAVHVVAEAQPGEVMAFLLAFREGADYDSPNYQWFASRYERFLYVDRVVVSSVSRAGGLGSRLYQQVFTQAAEQGVPLVTCEFDVEPPNPASERFHAKFGFVEVGRQSAAGGAKRVSLQVASVPPQNAA